MAQKSLKSKVASPSASAKATADRKSKTKSAKLKPRRRRKQTPGPKPSITLDVVRRVSERVGRGMTLELALATEAVPTVNVETWKKALKAHPEFSPHYEAAKGKFLDESMQRLANHHDVKWLCWLLARRHSDLFGKKALEGGADHQAEGATALPAELIERARAVVREDESKVQGSKSKA